MRGEGAWIDLSRPLSEATPVWPGDVPWSLSWTMRIEEGASVNVAALSGSAHAGTHAESALHVEAGGAPLEAVPLDAFVGAAEILDVAAPPGGPTVPTVGVDEVEERIAPDTERLLLRTGCDWSEGFPTRFRALSEPLARWCVERGLRLVGTDAPSIDPYDSKRLAAHRIVAGAGIAVLESLALARARPGRYELIALPLPIDGAEASPVRAVARPISSRTESDGSVPR